MAYVKLLAGTKQQQLHANSPAKPSKNIKASAQSQAKQAIASAQLNHILKPQVLCTWGFVHSNDSRLNHHHLQQTDTATQKYKPTPPIPIAKEVASLGFQGPLA